jgi:hypothetical protein
MSKTGMQQTYYNLKILKVMVYSRGEAYDKYGKDLLQKQIELLKQYDSTDAYHYH